MVNKKRKIKDRLICSVSVNEVDYPLLYAAIKGDVSRSVFPNISNFLAQAGEEKLEKIKESGDEGVRIADMFEEIKSLIEEIVKSGVKLSDDSEPNETDEADELLRNLFSFS